MQSYENLVFQGGGVQGFAYLGAIKKLQEKGLIQDVHRFAGSSVGSMMALALAMGVDTDSIFRCIKNLSSKILKGGRGYISASFHFLKSWGFYSTKSLRKFIGDFIYRWAGNENITFAELKEKFGTELWVISTSLGRGDSVVFSPLLTPTARVIDAIEMSVCIPIYYQPIKTADDVLVDSGLINNTPLHLFDGGKNPSPNPRTLCLTVIADDEVALFSIEPSRRRLTPIKNLPAYLKRIVAVTIEHASMHFEHPDDRQRTLEICVGDIDAFDFDLTLTQKRDLVNVGYQYAHRWLEKSKK